MKNTMLLSDYVTLNGYNMNPSVKALLAGINRTVSWGKYINRVHIIDPSNSARYTGHLIADGGNIYLSERGTQCKRTDANNLPAFYRTIASPGSITGLIIHDKDRDAIEINSLNINNIISYI